LQSRHVSVLSAYCTPTPEEEVRILERVRRSKARAGADVLPAVPEAGRETSSNSSV
jgi:hypothetical protein